MIKKINNRQLLFLLVSMIISTADIFLPSVVAKYAKSDSWFSVIIVTLFGLLDAYVIVNLSMKYKNKTLIEILQFTLGKYVGKIFGVIFFIIFVFTNAVIIRELGEILKTLFLPGIPIELLIILTTLVSAYGTYKGLEVIVRTNEIAFPLGMVILLFVIFFSLGYVEFDRFLPLFENGIYPSVRGALPMFTWISEVIIVSMIFPYLNNPKDSLRTVFIAVLALGLMFIGGTFTILVFGADATSKLIFAPFSIIESIAVERVIRFDVFIMSVWIVGIFIKSIMFYFISIESIVRTFNLKNFNEFIIPVGITTSVFAVTEFDNIVQLLEYFGRILYLLFTTLYFFIPLILLIITKVKKVRT